MDNRSRIGTTALGLVGVAAVGLGTYAATTQSALAEGNTPSPSSSTSQTPTDKAPTDKGPGDKGDKGGRHEHTPATDAEKAKVIAAVKAKDAAVSVTEVVKDPDGSFDARGTKAGSPVMVEVSKDYATVEARTGGPGGGREHGTLTAASADEKAKVIAAVKAKDSAVTVQDVRKASDGSFRARGTKAGSEVMVEVSKDYATVTVRTGGPGGQRPGGHGAFTAASADEKAKVIAAIKAKDAAVTVKDVMKSSDGTFHAFGDKGGQRVFVDVSKDYSTVTVKTGR